MIHSLTISITDGHSTVSQGELSVAFDRFDGSHDQYSYTVTCAGEQLASGTDLRMPSASGLNHVKAMESLITFLLADAEKYEGLMRRPEIHGTSDATLYKVTGEVYSFSAKTAEWAYGMSEELAIVGLELVPEDDDAGEDDGGPAEPFGKGPSDHPADQEDDDEPQQPGGQCATTMGDERCQLEDEHDGPHRFGNGPPESPADEWTVGERVMVRNRFTNAEAGAGTVTGKTEELYDHGGPESGPEEPELTDLVVVRYDDGQVRALLPSQLESIGHVEGPDERLSEPEEERPYRPLRPRERFAVQRRYTEATDDTRRSYSSLAVGVWGDVLTNGHLESMRQSFEWGARGGTTAEGVVVPSFSKSLKADERLVRIVHRETVEVLDEELYEPRRIIAVYKGWLIRRYETDELAGGSKADFGLLDAAQIDGVGISAGYEADELDTLKDWIDGAPNRVKPPCECMAVSERALHGNVHTEEGR